VVPDAMKVGFAENSGVQPLRGAAYVHSHFN
jgi:hypothetical protein